MVDHAAKECAMKGTMLVLLTLFIVTLFVACSDTAHEEQLDALDDTWVELEVMNDFQEDSEDSELSDPCPLETREGFQIKLYTFFSENENLKDHLECEPGPTGYPDVFDDSLLETALSCCVQWGCALSGYGDGTWAPSDPLQRAQVVQRLFATFKLDKEVVESNVFEDVDETIWYAEAINVLAQLGVISSDSRLFYPLDIADNCFVDELLTRDSNGNGVENLLEDFPLVDPVELTRGKLAMRLWQTYLPDCRAEEGAAPFPDITSDSEYWDAVTCLVNEGVLYAYPDGTYRADKPISRLESAQVLVELTDLPLMNQEFRFLDDANSEPSYPDTLMYWSITPQRLVFRPGYIMYTDVFEAWLAAEPVEP